nr:SpoIIE family protein phosphatase [Kitasatospora viridis]
MPGLRSIAGQVFASQVVVVVLLIAAAVVALVLQARRDSENEAGRRSLAVAEAVAHAPGTVAALTSADPAAVLQPQAQGTQQAAGVDFIVVWGSNGITYANPDTAMIGTHVTGSGTPPDKASTLTTKTSDGLAVVVALVPVTQPEGPAVGTVGVGIKVRNVHNAVDRQLPVVLGTAAGVLAVAAGGTALVSRRLRRQTRGLGPAAMTRMYEHHDAVLHAVREGVVIVDGDGQLLLANDEARRLLDLPPDCEGRPVTGLGLEAGVAGLLASGRVATDEVHLAGDRLLAVNVRSTGPQEPPGWVATLRDTTELRALAGRAEVARERLTLLYEAGLRIGTTLDVAHTAEELAQAAVPRFADFVTVELLDLVLRGEEPAGASTEMRRVAVSGIHADHPLIPVGELIRFAPSTPPAAVVEHGRAVIEADLRAAHGWRAQDPESARRILAYGLHSLITAPLQARGVVLGMVNFWRAENDPFEQDDVTFAEELAARAAVCLDNARRYTREHALAVALQRSLLPHGVPELSSLEVAHRYRSAQPGVGGDWFDVIPLPGTRTALVVGDVVGHGLHAAATMGRLRTAVHNFSALDLPPDEILARLDELVARIDRDEAREEQGAGITGARCLYAIYDPVSGRCTVARAGHLGPALVGPDGTVTFPDVPLSPPLGLGGSLPFEVAELQLAAGSNLVLYTNGLVEDRDRDLDVGLDSLRDALGDAAGRAPEETCEAVFSAMVPARPRDDVALLVARTRLLDPVRVADWDVPSDPAAVAPIRTECARQLQEWGLEEIQFNTELILSELITNAIRYGTEPIHVRLLHDRSLVCEISDASNTSPHLRRARASDEGGRGLFLVAQFAERWGTRYTSRGKVIWTEQPLHDGVGEETGGDLGDILLAQWDDDLL